MHMTYLIQAVVCGQLLRSVLAIQLVIVTLVIETVKVSRTETICPSITRFDRYVKVVGGIKDKDSLQHKRRATHV